MQVTVNTHRPIGIVTVRAGLCTDQSIAVNLETLRRLFTRLKFKITDGMRSDRRVLRTSTVRFVLSFFMSQDVKATILYAAQMQKDPAVACRTLTATRS